MAYRSLKDFVALLERAGELRRIKTFVNPHLEIAEIVDRISKKGGPALLFENTGTDFPLLINAYGSKRRMEMALGVDDLDQLAREFEGLFSTLMKPRDGVWEKLAILPKLGALASWMPKVKTGRGACQQVIMDPPDLRRLPIMTCWPDDGGPFLTLPVIHTRSPQTGIRNVGMYRMQVFDHTLTAVHWHKHKVSAKHFQEYKKLHKRMPVAVALGGDPVYAYVATAPLPEQVDEYVLAGFIRKKRVELVKCLTQDIEVPADADIVIEGYVDPDEELILEGPFGDHTGYYSLPDYYPRFHVTCITHRRDAIYPSTIVGIPPQEDAWLGKATERLFIAPIRMTLLPELVDMELPIEGVFHNLTIVKIHSEYPGHATKVCHALWGAGQMMFNKILVVTDEDVDIHDYREVARCLSRNVDVRSDIYFSYGPMDVLDHACSRFAFGGKMAIDATRKYSIAPGEEMPPEPLTPAEIEDMLRQWPELRAINTSLLAEGIAIGFVAVEKKRANHIRELAESLFRQSPLQRVKMLLFLEAIVPADDLRDMVWRWCNNFDPQRDSYIVDTPDGPHAACIAFDGTRKTLALDRFQRPWPNIICSDEKTINAVDARWEELQIGPFCPSPSRKYLKQRYGSGAMV